MKERCSGEDEDIHLAVRLTRLLGLPRTWLFPCSIRCTRPMKINSCSKHVRDTFGTTVDTRPAFGMSSSFCKNDFKRFFIALAMAFSYADMASVSKRSLVPLELRLFQLLRTRRRLLIRASSKRVLSPWPQPMWPQQDRAGKDVAAPGVDPP